MKYITNTVMADIRMDVNFYLYKGYDFRDAISAAVDSYLTELDDNITDEIREQIEDAVNKELTAQGLDNSLLMWYNNTIKGKGRTI